MRRRRGSPEVERRLRLYLAAAGLGLGLSGTLLGVDEQNGLVRLWSLHVGESRLEESIASLAKERRERTRLAHDLRDDDDAIERLAREKLGMLRPDEIVVRLEPRNDDVPRLSAGD